MTSVKSHKLLDDVVDFFVDAIIEKFQRRHFKMQTSESRVKNIHFTISKNKALQFSTNRRTFELLTKPVDVIYQYHSRRYRFFRRNHYSYTKFVSRTRYKYYHFVISRYDYF